MRPDWSEVRFCRSWFAPLAGFCLLLSPTGGFAACKLLETLGPFAATAVSEFHDQRCRVNENLPLA